MSKILCMIFILLLQLVYCVHRVCADFTSANEAYYNRNGRLTMLRKNWMASIDDSVYLHQLSLPATHDTMAFYGGPFVQTQVMSLNSQLRVGIRVFDIRCRHVHDIFEIHHGPIYQRSDMDHVLTTMTNFLGNYPSEVLLVRIKEEHVPENNSRSFADTVEYYLNKPGFRTYIWRGNTTVRLGDVRGKIVILRNFPTKQPLGITWERLIRQDDYIVPTLFSIGAKWLKVKDHLERARISSCDHFYVNFLSGTSPGAYPRTIARRINRYTMEWLIRSQVDYIGIIFMDFPGEGLIKTIIDLNRGLKVTNSFEEPMDLHFVCNESQERRTLSQGQSFRYQNKVTGSNSCKFWAGKKEADLRLKSGNENIVVTENGFFRQRDGFADRQEVGRWPISYTL